MNVRWKLAFALAFAAGWCLLSAWIARPWFGDLSALTGPIFAGFIIAGIALIPGFANAFLLGGLLLDRRPRFSQFHDLPPLTVLIAAYNEERHIGDTLGSIAAQRYAAEVEVIVIDDGSSDRTVERVQAIISGQPRQIGRSLRLLRMPRNGGKASALNAGLAEARHEHVVTLDGDTYLFRDALRNLALNHIHSPINTRATAGTVLARNSRQNLLTRLQEWDYFQGIAVVKRIQSLFQGTLVAQGAFSIYEREALQEIGGWAETVGEDIVLTWALIDHDYRVGYAENAFAFTNVPTTLGAYYRQRRRWARGLIEAFKRFPQVLIRPRLNLPFIYLNLLFPFLDLIFLTVFVPGILAAVFFQFYAVVGIMTLLLLPLALAISAIMFAHQRRIFRAAGLNVRRNYLGFLGYLIAYQLVLTPASLAGYFGEFFNFRKSW
ncbi:glycosyltransferase [Algiphilus aromaticivorans]|uniref:glycosyltransferase n=1 Tax=Algiphilus aromaticivorans TaxID=382454 RepID=UPI000A64A585|nr:glycosyltransferase [Algiphilus aromaticivorans]